MYVRIVSCCLVVLGVLAFCQPASAQECPCNCYFSGDCAGTAFCNWGTLSIEDTCFWRTPKPQGTPGAGCQQDYDDWGQCDGICDDGSRSSVFGGEDQKRLSTAVRLWALALDGAARAGGGFPDQELVEQLERIPFGNGLVVIATGRVVVETMMYARGMEFAVMPEGRTVLTGDVAVQGDPEDPHVAKAAGLLIEVLMAEMREAGSGGAALSRLSANMLDRVMLDRICGQSDDPLACVYQRIVAMATAVSRSSGGGAPRGGGGDPCIQQIMGDIDYDGDIDHKDAIALVKIQLGLPTDPSWNLDHADMNGDGQYDSMDTQLWIDAALGF